MICIGGCGAGCGIGIGFGLATGGGGGVGAGGGGGCICIGGVVTFCSICGITIAGANSFPQAAVPTSVVVASALASASV